VYGSEPSEADAQSAEVLKPLNGPLHDPACFAPPAIMRLTAWSDFGCNAGGLQWTSIFVVILAYVALNDPRLR
jgi:hypothetical protein